LMDVHLIIFPPTSPIAPVILRPVYPVIYIRKDNNGTNRFIIFSENA
jgi:hypothetical protein